MRSSLPLLIERVMQGLAAFAIVLLAEQFLPVRRENKPTLIVVELVVHISLIGGQV